jgi:outer membrane receptor protein involved in Fe transport
MVSAFNAAGVIENQPLALNAMDAPNNASGNDQFTLWSLGIDWDLGKLQLISSSSYFDRTNSYWSDATLGYVSLVPEFFLASDHVTPTGLYPPLGWKAMSHFDDSQSSIVEELRVQSKNSDARLSWVAGIFYSHTKQSESTPDTTNFLVNAPSVAFGSAVIGGPPFYSDCGVPGPCTAFQNFTGADMLPNAGPYLGIFHRTDKQLSGFAQADYRVAEQWTLTLGLRLSSNTLDFNAAYLGPLNNSNAPFGGASPCPPAAAPCVFGSGPAAPSYPSSSTHFSDTATTPKFGIAYQANADNMLYATAAKGFRPGGASLRVPHICDSGTAQTPGLVQLGYVDANGNPAQPTTYQSDSLWSYELGSKSRLLGGRLVLDASAYEIKWANIQATITVPICGSRFVDNLANATSKGFDLGFRFNATERLGFDGAVGYIKASFDQDATSPNGSKVLYNGGSSVPNTGPPWMLSLSGDYTLPLMARYRGYARADFTYSAEWRRFGVTDPGTASYDPRQKPTPAYSVLNLRLGTQFDAFDVSLFVKNLTNANPNLLLFGGDTSNGPASDWYGVAVQPRSIGLTMTWRK